jgi:uncharacterized OB-fold protein
VPGFERAAIYVPHYSVNDRAILSPDEDAFTMAIAALESLGEPSGAPAAGRIHLVGAVPAALDWAFGAYLGLPTELAHHPAGSEGYLTALEAAERTEGDRPYQVVAVDLGGPQGALAVALQFGPAPSSTAPDWGSVVGIEGAAALARAALTRDRPVGAPGACAPGPNPPWPIDSAAAFANAAPTPVSEGAYVPRPRYLENLPSRWRLEADRCARCDRLTFPRRGVCRVCGRSDRLSAERLPRDGARVVATTTLAKGGQPTEFDAQVAALGGYGVVLAEFAPGVRLTLQLTDVQPGEIRIGDRIDTRLRRLYPMEGEWRYGRKGVPATV